MLARNLGFGLRFDTEGPELLEGPEGDAIPK